MCVLFSPLQTRIDFEFLALTRYEFYPLSVVDFSGDGEC